MSKVLDFNRIIVYYISVNRIIAKRSQQEIRRIRLSKGVILSGFTCDEDC